MQIRRIPAVTHIKTVFVEHAQTKCLYAPCVGILPKINLLFGPLVIQLVWYILKQLFTSVPVEVVDIYLHFGE